MSSTQLLRPSASSSRSYRTDRRPDTDARLTVALWSLSPRAAGRRPPRTSIVVPAERWCPSGGPASRRRPGRVRRSPQRGPVREVGLLGVTPRRSGSARGGPLPGRSLSRASTSGRPSTRAGAASARAWPPCSHSVYSLPSGQAVAVVVDVGVLESGFGYGRLPGYGTALDVLVVVVVEVERRLVLVAVLDAVAVGVGVAGVDAEGQLEGVGQQVVVVVDVGEFCRPSPSQSRWASRDGARG